MKTFIFTITILLLTSSVSFAETCADKVKSIENQIEFAQAHNNYRQLKGLQKALANTQANCDDLDLEQKKAHKIRDKQADIKDAEQDLAKAVNQGKNSAKIQKKQLKLQEKQQELKQLTD